MLGCYILCNEIRVKVDRLMVEGQGSWPGKVKVEDIDSKSTDKRSKYGHETND
jgi:hypothetical protein